MERGQASQFPLQYGAVSYASHPWTFAVLGLMPMMGSCADEPSSDAKPFHEAGPEQRDEAGPPDSALAGHEPDEAGAIEKDSGSALAPDSSADPNGFIVPRTEDRFVSVQILYGSSCQPGSSCLGSVTRAVRAPGVLVLADSQGEERFDLPRASYERLLDIALTPELVAAIRDPDECHNIPDGGGLEVAIEWDDLGKEVNTHGQSCDGDANHVFHRLGIVLAELQAEVFECPDRDPDTGLAARGLCNSCKVLPRDSPNAC